jgi:hypothetical protein
VQAVLLGLRERGIDHALVLVPPLPVFLRSGFLMPVAKIDDGVWMPDSERILVALGFSEVKEADRRALQALFLGSGMRRADDPWQFWARFSRVRDGHPASARRHWNQFWRAFSMFYFFTLITLGRRRRPAEPVRPEFATLQARLTPGTEFFGGAGPDTVDFQLFGIVQMLASIPGPALTVLREDPALERLRAWVESMQRRYSDSPHLYSGPYFEPVLPPVEPAPVSERVAYWCGAAFMWLLLPLTLAATFYFFRRVRKQGLVDD